MSLLHMITQPNGNVNIQNRFHFETSFLKLQVI